MAGIVSYGGYIPRYRLKRRKIFEATGWMNGSNIALSSGEKAVANYDEDSITMAVSAGNNALIGFDREKIGGVYFASTTMSYKERLNAGIVAGALGLGDHIRSADYGGSLRAGTTSLMSALDAVEAGRVDNMVVCASECRLGKPGGSQEMIFGDAAGALVLGSQNVVAEFKGCHSITYDFVDHYRGAQSKYDRQWEDRWIRDEGYDRFIPEVVKGLLEQYAMGIGDFAKVIYPCHYASERKKLNKLLGISPEKEQADLFEQIGDTGTAQPLVMLVCALESAAPGDKILVVSFGNGCDALYFEVTDKIREVSAQAGITESLSNGSELDNYVKYLIWRDILPGEVGLRGEEDLWTRFSALWRLRKFVLGLWAGKCRNCGTVHLPPQRMCVNPDCGAVDQMEAVRFSDKIGRIASYTGDNLAASLNPPAIYGAVTFEGGGKCYFDFTDCSLDDLSTGMAVKMSFRRKYYDKRRDICGYFWKAVPVKEMK